MATLVQCCFKLIQGDVFVGGEYVNDTYRWKSTGETLNTSLWAPYQPSSQEKCIQLWQKWGGLDDTSARKYKRVLCEKVFTFFLIT